MLYCYHVLRDLQKHQNIQSIQLMGSDPFIIEDLLTLILFVTSASYFTLVTCQLYSFHYKQCDVSL